MLLTYESAYEIYKNGFQTSKESFLDESSHKHMVYLQFLVVHFRDFEFIKEVADFYQVIKNSEFFIALWSHYYLGILIITTRNTKILLNTSKKFIV